MWVWESPPSPPQARTLVSKSRDHGNDAMVAQYVFLILGHATSWETLREMDVKNFQCYYKQQITNSFPWSIYTFIDHRNDIKMFKTTVKPHAYDLWFHFHCLLVRDTHKNQAWSRGVGWGNGCQYTWFLFPEIPICQTIVHAYPKLLASPDKQKCAAFFLTSMVRKVSTLKLMGHSILIFGNACSYPFKI